MFSLLKNGKKLDGSIREQFKRALEKRAISPHVISAKLNHNLANLYKIKLRTSGYRLVYEVIDRRLVILLLQSEKEIKRLLIKKL